MKRTIKIKLSFKPETQPSERVLELMRWARGVYKISSVNVIEISHFERMSYIIIENPRKAIQPSR